MKPDDPRHGTYAGAVAHWLTGERPCLACATEETRYRKRRKMRHLRGDAPTVPAVGTLRRIQALHALGWTGPQIAEAAGLPVNTLRSVYYHQVRVVRAGTAQRVADAFDRLAMSRPEGKYANRARAMAERRGWPPPLAWDDIDDPNEIPDMTEIDSLPDPVVVQRILDGDWRLKANPAERAMVVRRWTGSAADLARLTGWKVERYVDREGAA